MSTVVFKLFARQGTGRAYVCTYVLTGRTLRVFPLFNPKRQIYLPHNDRINRNEHHLPVPHSKPNPTM